MLWTRNSDRKQRTYFEGDLDLVTLSQIESEHCAQLILRKISFILCCNVHSICLRRRYVKLYHSESSSFKLIKLYQNTEDVMKLSNLCKFFFHAFFLNSELYFLNYRRNHFIVFACLNCHILCYVVTSLAHVLMYVVTELARVLMYVVTALACVPMHIVITLTFELCYAGTTLASMHVVTALTHVLMYVITVPTNVQMHVVTVPTNVLLVMLL